MDGGTVGMNFRRSVAPWFDGDELGFHPATKNESTLQTIASIRYPLKRGGESLSPT